jgi:hypothetical protein
MDASTEPPVDQALPSRELLGLAGIGSAQQRTHDCARPVRLHGSTTLVNRATGETRTVYSSAQELDGSTWVPCGNRRASACEPCSTRYKGDAWQLINTGLAGGKGIPASVAAHPCTFVTLTAPSFGPVHGVRQKGPCRGRRDHPVCRHGRPLWCSRRHHDDDPRLGEPLCVDCYDYTAHLVWQWYVPELWRRFMINLQRELAHRCALPTAVFRERCKISYSKVVEFQVRAAVHVHAPIRLDGPDGPDGASPALALGLSSEDLEDAIRVSAARVDVLSAPLADGRSYRLRWGSQVDCRTITDTAERDSLCGTRRELLVHPEQVASYLSKYLTKATEDFGVPAQVRSAAHAVAVGASAHAVRLIATAEDLAGQHPDYALLLTHLATLGYRGHPITKSRAYSVTFGQLRRARRRARANPAGLPPDADVRQILDDDRDLPDGFELVSSWVFAGQGYIELDQAAAAVQSATRARIRHHRLDRLISPLREES